ncbi:MAG TPA: YhcN/YlaJ family sporulation lipoprotein [Pseudoneobacillus sp.]|nr:YhcN/YlaJ family sporulation lipoprotein [Pseudoneobacillus sp.]
MNKKYLVLPLTAGLAFSLTGCGSNDEAGVQNRNKNTAQPMGYYSNENHKGNATIVNDNDGPVTEMMDHSLGNERNTNDNGTQGRDKNGNPVNPTRPLAKTDRNFFQHDNRFSNGDANYHGHLNDNTKKARSSYYTAYEGDLAEKIGAVTGSVPNVEDVRSVTYGSNVLIAVDLTDYSKEESTKNDIKEAVQPYLRGRSVTVVTDEGTFSRLRHIDNDLRNGGPRDRIDTDLKNMFQNFKNRLSNNNNDNS